MATPQLQLHVLGGFRILSDGGTVTVPVTAAKLMAFLAVNDRPMSRSQVAGTVWPALAERQASANLRSIVWRLPAAAHPIVVSTGKTLSLADSLDVDLHRAGGLVRRILDHTEPLSLLDSVDEIASVNPVALLCCPLLPEWDDDWLVFERERIRQRHIHALERLAESLLAAGDPRSAVDVSIAVIGAEPLRESSHLLAIQAHLAAGNRLDARRCYQRYCDLLWHELGVEPSVRWTDFAAVAVAATLDSTTLNPAPMTIR